MAYRRGSSPVYHRDFVPTLPFIIFTMVFQSVQSQVAPTLSPNHEFVYPLPCDFEESYCQWVQMTDDNFDWTRNSGSTPSGSTGPTGDHSKSDGSGYYAFIEVSSPRTEDEVARLISDYLLPALNENCSMTFYHSMYGSDIGQLNIYTREEGSNTDDLRWSKQNNQGNSWIEGSVIFYNIQRPFQVIIEGVVGDGVRGDIAIDDTSFSEGCYRGVEGKVRLGNSRSTDQGIEGRVEIFHDSEWGTICSYMVWDDSTDGKVACRQLGYTDTTQVQRLLSSTGLPFHLDNVTCIGTEQNLTQCGHNGWGNIRAFCSHQFDDAMVHCTAMAPPPCQPTQFTCSNEVCINNGQLCDYKDNCGDGSDENPSLCDSYPGRCDFQDDLCNWIQLRNDDFDWTRHKGSTDSPNTGPTSDHNGNADHYYMYMEVSGRPIYNRTKLALAQPFQPTTDGRCKIRFYYHMDGRDVGYLKLQQLGMTSHEVKTVFEQRTDKGSDWQYQQIALSSDENFQLYFEGEVGRSSEGDVAIDDISFSLDCKLDTSGCGLPSGERVFNCTDSGECISYEHTCDFHHNCLDGTDEAASLCNSRPGRCDFQHGFCTWSQSCFDNFDWKRNKGSTPTPFTGPSRDHTLKNVLGYYAYIAAHEQNIGDAAELISTSWSASATEPCKIRFYYHMDGVGIGSLSVVVKDIASTESITKWTISGQQGYEWEFASVDLQNSYSEFEVIIRAVRGSDNEGQGDIAIDDVSFTEGCQPQLDLLPPDVADGVRLVNGSGTHEGRLEVFYSGQWGTVCDNGFDMNDAQVVCAHLGYDAALNFAGQAHFGRGSGQIWLTNVQCNGDETSLFDCSHSDWNDVGSCSHGDDVGVVCNTTGTSGHAIRLSGGRPDVPFEGRVEVMHGGKWGTICNTSFDREEALVVCKQLHYDDVLEIKSFGPGTGEIHLGYLECCGNEDNINECRHSAWGVHSCDHSQDAGVVCRSNDHPQEGETRLANSNHNYAGRLEIYHDHQWGTICSSGWTVKNAEVACRARLFSYVLIYLTSEYGPGTGNIHLSNVDCTGTEQQISDCSNDGWGSHTCTHSQDVGIECSSTAPSIALVTSTDNTIGCVQLTNNQGKQVCLNGASVNTLTVICRELGFEDYERLDTSSMCSTGKPRVMNLASCSGNEDKLSDCSNYAWKPASGSQCSNDNNDPKLVCIPRATTTMKPMTIQPRISTQEPSQGIFTINGECSGIDGVETYRVVDRVALVWSPNYPKSYPNNLDCVWTVHLTPGGRIDIQFEALHTEANDELVIRDGQHEVSPVLQRYIGIHFPDPVTTNGPDMYISFKSDSFLSYTGFKLHLSVDGDPLPVIHTGQVRQQCCTSTSEEPLEDTFDAASGLIKSPNYPQRYPSSLSCGWMIKLAEGSKVQVSFESMAIQDDKLTIYDGNSLDPDTILGEYQYSSRIDNSKRRRRSDDLEGVTASRNVAVLIFTTNSNNEDSGFQSKYEEYTDGKTPVPVAPPSDNLTGAIVGSIICVIAIVVVVILFIFGYKYYKQKSSQRGGRYQEQVNSASSINVNDPMYAEIQDDREAPPAYAEINQHTSTVVIQDGQTVSFVNNRYSVAPSAPPPPAPQATDANGHVVHHFYGTKTVALPDERGYETPKPTQPSQYERPHAYDSLRDSGKYETPQPTHRSQYERPHANSQLDSNKYETMKPGIAVGATERDGSDSDIKKGAYVNLPPESDKPKGFQDCDKRVYGFLLELELEDCADNFAAKGIKYDQLLSLHERDLSDLGIAMGDRKKIKKKIKKLKRETKTDSMMEAGNHGHEDSPKTIVVQGKKRETNDYETPYPEGRPSSRTMLTPHQYEDIDDAVYPIPEKLLCPITKTLMIDPVKCSDGHTYEKQAITDWLQEKGTSPVTKQVVFDVNLIPDTELEKEIQKFKKHQKRKQSKESKKKKAEQQRSMEQPEFRPETPMTDVDM
ncbi:scavenger receptor cysteine-rich domain-containing protein DMBT1-like isoform X2 [Ptychodera flava]|uniref:scavenger receptor cysteine-rich domain-containing protein DMBT1-like isoform X2 n=1 Tax=Ptychodera flava TaxID=63121 RepID=UPI00396A0C40